MLIKVNNVELANGAVRAQDQSAGPTDFRLNGRRLEQERQFTRATAVSMKDRGNLKTSISFGVTRLHASVEDAEYFVLSHYQSLPGEGDVVFTARSASGGVARLKLVNATIAITDHHYKGCRTWHSYQISGGAMEKGT